MIRRTASRCSTCRAIDRAIGRAPNRRGVAKLRAAIADYRPPPFTRSGLEREVHEALAQRTDLPPYLTNQRVGGVEVDVWFPGSRFAVQIDTPDYHGSPDKFETDRSDDIKLDLHGCRHIRITGKRWNNERDRVLWEIETLSRLPPPVAAEGLRAPTPGSPCADRRRSDRSTR